MDKNSYTKKQLESPKSKIKDDNEESSRATPFAQCLFVNSRSSAHRKIEVTSPLLSNRYLISRQSQMTSSPV